ncbi:MAG: amino acid adenylation domain-containing protein [Gammaproteobacteria bacterium]|nr:amino acid adenylation domain-containing protein [Gammaproteobacteria bacterium]
MSNEEVFDAYQLSPLQAGMLYQCVARPVPDLYVEQFTCPLEGPLQMEAFERAWELALSRHAPLRTAFAWDGMPEPIQVVGDKVKLPLRVLVWGTQESSASDARLDALKREERLKGFDLSRAPLLRLVVVVLGPTSYHLIWTWHHIVLDAWSGPVLLDEVLTAYAAYIDGKLPELPEVRPYKEFVAFARAPLDTEASTFWRRTLGDLHETRAVDLGVPEPPRPDEADYQLLFRDLSNDRIPALRVSAATFGVTLNTLVQCAWALVLGNCQGTQDVLFGTAVSGRPAQLPGVERMVGLFINTLPVRVQFRAGQPLRNLLQALQAQLVAARQYEHMPLVDIHACSLLPAGQPMFESLLVFEDFEDQQHSTQAGQLQLGAADFIERADFPLTVLFSVRDGKQLGVGFERALIDPASAARLLARLDQTLGALVTDVNATVGAIEVLPDDERDLLRRWSRDPDWCAPPDCERSVTRAFEEQVATTPELPAAVYWTAQGDITLTYRELDARANRMAVHLRKQGIGPGNFVAICMEAGLARLTGVLAAMKAGAAYVPLDPRMPLTALAELIADCAAATVLVDVQTESKLSELTTLSALLCAEDGADFAQLPADPPQAAADPRDAAYMIYTSGSTGRRKGVVIEHHALARMVAAQRHPFRIGHGTRVLQFASFSFDASVSEIFSTLLYGGTLYMAPRERLVPSAEFLDLLHKWRINTITLPPSVLARLPLRELPDLQVLVTAGEPCTTELVNLWAPGRTYINAYGPTECTVCATLGAVKPGDPRPSIGRAMGEVEVHVLDPQLRPSPIGAAGELCLGGPQLARGYWQRPELEAVAFVPHPFDVSPEARLYRTGDRVRFLPDGRLDFLGRIDHQLKLRGRRVEPGEIETALRSADTVSDAAVVAVEDNDEHQLIAFITPQAATVPQWWPSISEFLVYDDLAYHAMSSDQRRNDSYRAALAKHAPGKVVLDIGTGPEALLSRFAIEAGARKVYAIELLKDTFEKARAKVHALGLHDRIEVIHADATTVRLPEPADISLSEIVGAIGGSEGSAEIIKRTRHLLTDAPAIIPEKSVTLFAPVQLPDALLAEQGFSELPARYVERIFHESGHPFDLRLCVRGLSYAALLSQPAAFEDFDYRRPVSAAYRDQTTFQIARPGRCDGFLVWLTLDCGAGPVLDILRNEHCWLPVFFPLGATGVRVTSGDRIEARFGATLCEDRLHTDYFVEGTVRCGQTEHVFAHHAPHHGRAFRESPFHAQFFASQDIPRLSDASKLDTDALADQLRSRLPDYMLPTRIVELAHLPLNTAGKVDRQVLTRKAQALRATMAQSPPPTPAGSAAEQQVATIWAEVLRQPVDPERNFFEQGGHSLLLLSLQSKLQHAAGRPVEITDLFKFSTIAAQARYFLTAKTQPDNEGLELSRAAARVTARTAISTRRLARGNR